MDNYLENMGICRTFPECFQFFAGLVILEFLAGFLLLFIYNYIRNMMTRREEGSFIAVYTFVLLSTFWPGWHGICDFLVVMISYTPVMFIAPYIGEFYGLWMYITLLCIILNSNNCYVLQTLPVEFIKTILFGERRN